jgi:predicted nucleic acid-binding protein
MATTTKRKQTTIIDVTVNNALGLVTKANDIALITTEKVMMKSINLTEKGVGFSSKMLKKGLKASAKKQDFVFNSLETVKGKAIKFLPKFK